MASPHTNEIMKEMERVRNQQAKKSTKVEPTIEQRNERILNLLDQGIKVKDVAARMGVTSATVYQVKSSGKKDKKEEIVPFLEPVIKTIKPLREKEIEVQAKSIKLPSKSSASEIVEGDESICSSDENDGLKSQILDLNRQLDRYRENEKNMQLELIDQRQSYEKVIEHLEKSLAVEYTEKEKAYADYSSEVENNKRLRKQVEDLLMIDGLNVGLMQQNLMFRERFGKLQEGEVL